MRTAKRSMPVDVRYETIDIAKANAKGYNIRLTPTLMVFVDGKLEHTSSGLLRGDRLTAFLDRWGFSKDEPQPEEVEPADDDFNPWTNNRRWNRGPVRDRIDNAKSKFAWWLLGKWLGFAAGGAAIILGLLIIACKTWRTVRETSPQKDGPRSGTRQRTKTTAKRNVKWKRSV